MESRRLLQDYLNDAIAHYCADNGLGIPSAFVYCVSRIDENGSPVLTIGDSEGQQTWQSLGLVAYMQEWFKDDATQQIAAAYQLDEGDD